MEGERFKRPEQAKKIPERKRIPEEEISIPKAIDLLSEGNVAKEDKDFEKAIECYQNTFYIYKKLAEQYKKDPKVVAGFKESRNLLNETKREWAKILYNQGEKSITEGKHPKAIEYFQKAVGENPKLIEGWVKLGNLLTISGSYEGAHRSLKEGLRSNQESKERWKIWNGLGKLFLQIGEFPRAYTSLLEAAKLEKENFAVPYNLAIALLNLPIGDSTVNAIKAIKYLEEAEKKNPISSEIKSTKGFASFRLGQLGKSVETMAHYEKALKFLDEATEQNPDDIGAWYNKGLLLPILQRGEPKDWLKKSNKCFDEVFRILEMTGEKKTESIANVWYQKALIWKYWSDSNPYREKEHRNKDLKQCAKCLNISLEIIQSLKIMPSEEFQKLYIEVEAELKRIEEWTKFGGAKKVKPTPDFNVMYA